MSPERMRRCVAKLMELGFGFGIGLNFQLFAFKSRCRYLCRSPHLMECTLEFINVPSFVCPSVRGVAAFIFHFTLYELHKNWYNIFVFNSSVRRQNEWMNEWNCRVRRQTKDAKRKKIMQIKSELFFGRGCTAMKQWSAVQVTSWNSSILLTPLPSMSFPQWTELIG